MFQYLAARVRAWFTPAAIDQDLTEEIESHISLSVDEHIRNGMPESQARRAAQLEFGGVTQLREAHRETRGLPWLDTLMQDLSYTFRMLRRDRAFTIFAILIAGLGIGASVTIFSVVNTLLLRPLPFHDPARLVWISTQADDNIHEWTLQVDHMLDLRRQSKSVTDMAAYFGFSSAGDSRLTGDGAPVRLSGVSVSCYFFSLLGVNPVVGRQFTVDECKWNGPKAALLSYGLWKSRYNLDPNIIGKSLTLNDAQVVIAGVLPETFDFSGVFTPGNHVEIFSPFPLTPETNRWGNTLWVLGRLKPGVSVQSAQGEFTLLAQQIVHQHPERNGLRPILKPLDEHVNGRFRPALLVLACAVGVVMLIVCANLANLQLARAATRQKEIAIRVALGAGRKRLVRQMVTESLLLGICGAVPGLLLAIAGTRIFAHLDAFNIPLLSGIRVDSTSLLFTVLVALLTGLLSGLAAALQAPMLDVQETLKDGNRSTTSGARALWIRGALVVSEIAFACVLLVGTGLLVRSFLSALDVNLGFVPESTAALRIDPDRTYDTHDKRVAYYDEVLRVIRARHGITAAAITDALPLAANEISWSVWRQGETLPPGKQYPEVFIRVVSDGYLQTVGVRLLQGREFTARDLPATEPVAMINETMARTLYPGQNPIGRLLGTQTPRRVVGVVADVHHRAIEEDPGCELYIPVRQTDDFPSLSLVVRTSLPPAAMAADIRTALRPIDPNLAMNEFHTLQVLVDQAISPRRFVVWLLGGFSAFAVVLAALGIYALIAYSVSGRTREFGIRMALGAGAAELQRRVLGETLGLAAIGVVAGLAASWVLARALSGLLFGVTATDPMTFAAMVAVLTVVAACAGYFPARRASKIDPMAALRGNA